MEDPIQDPAAVTPPPVITDQQPPTPPTEPQLREPTEEELNARALQLVQQNPQAFGITQQQPDDDDEPVSYDPADIHSRAVREAETRMLQRQKLANLAVQDAKKAFAGKNIPDEAFSQITDAFLDPSLTVEDLKGHLQNRTHHRLVRDRVGEMVLEGQWSPQAMSGAEPVGGASGGFTAEQLSEKAKAEEFLGRKIADAEYREMVKN